jgi:hypothetical protein
LASRPPSSSPAVVRRVCLLSSIFSREAKTFGVLGVLGAYINAYQGSKSVTVRPQGVSRRGAHACQFVRFVDPAFTLAYKLPLTGGIAPVLRGASSPRDLLPTSPN